MASTVRLRAKRPFSLTHARKLVVGEPFRASAQLAERLIRRGDAVLASDAPPEPKPAPKARKAKASVSELVVEMTVDPPEVDV